MNWIMIWNHVCRFLVGLFSAVAGITITIFIGIVTDVGWKWMKQHLTVVSDFFSSLLIIVAILILVSALYSFGLDICSFAGWCGL